MKTVSIIGNGHSRRNNRPMEYEGDVWVCNYAFMEFALLPPIHTIGTVHREVVARITETKKYFGKNTGYHWVKRWRVLYGGKPAWGGGTVPFLGPRLSTGPMLIYQAIVEKYDMINLYGFDFEGGDLYGGYWADGSQKPCASVDWWREQIVNTLRELKPECRIVHHKSDALSDLEEWHDGIDI